ncbi:STAS domain-containing protein [Pseudoxanthomonas daejeonensis]|uniref:STAS domain-containing protein n=1 Tax=Pseudoxanthomonas daejeonensis TaxID=266062 RepID=UPI001F5435A2|nr:STAS domain-containing protein [Pseudoxanthomonas daejeonensis]UNK57370.1 STAS domain-containing protein [Pseudoxanthomonas daejeonensis]
MNTVSLGDDLGIEASADLKQRLSAHLEDPALALDGSAVKRVHTAAMQVLCAFFLSRGEQGRQTELASCSDALRDAARLLGLSTQLGLATNESSGDGQQLKQPVENPA